MERNSITNALVELRLKERSNHHFGMRCIMGDGLYEHWYEQFRQLFETLAAIDHEMLDGAEMAINSCVAAIGD